MIVQEMLQTKVSKTCDVLVCGGGFAGISAALAAARMGSRVVLLEREYMLGGLGTAGLITIYLPLCDGMGRQVSFGIAEELLRLSISMGWEAKYPENWLDSDDPAGRNENTKRFQVRYNAQLFAMLAEELLLKEGVEILYGTYAVSAARENDKIQAVIVENKSGRQAICAKSYVDATGDCDIAHFAGAPTANFKQGNILAAWYYFANETGYNLQPLGASDVPDSERAASKKQVKLLVDRRFTGLDGEEISQLVCLSHKATMADIQKKRMDNAAVMPVTLATIPQLRMTRKIVGEYELKESERHTHFADSVGMVSNWKKRGPVYEVPFGTLYNKTVKNLIVAGRCTSVDETMWDVMRVIPCCAVTGQAAGTAAAMTDDFNTLEIEKLQDELQKQGVILHESEL
ncbi:MAG: FAD-dependent oxidoreductase [Clostridia bacterium]|nr:FAD-dependent oxidoreductase [Clostridia bacterium]